MFEFRTRPTEGARGSVAPVNRKLPIGAILSKPHAQGVFEAAYRPAQEHTEFGFVDLMEKGTTPIGIIIFIFALPVEVAVSKTILTMRSDWRSVIVNVLPSRLASPVPDRVISCLPQR